MKDIKDIEDILQNVFFNPILWSIFFVINVLGLETPRCWTRPQCQSPGSWRNASGCLISGWLKFMLVQNILMWCHLHLWQQHWSRRLLRPGWPQCWSLLRSSCCHCWRLPDGPNTSRPHPPLNTRSVLDPVWFRLVARSWVVADMAIGLCKVTILSQ